MTMLLQSRDNYELKLHFQMTGISVRLLMEVPIVCRYPMKGVLTFIGL